MKKSLLVLLFISILIVGCSNNKETTTQVEPVKEENLTETWNIEKMEMSEEVLYAFPEDIYEFTTVNVNDINITDKYLRLEMSKAPSDIDPKVAFTNFKIKQVKIVHDKNNENIVYFNLNYNHKVTKMDFSKSPIEWSVIDDKNIWPSFKDALVIINRVE